MTAGSVDYWDFFVAETRRNPAPLYEQFALGVSRDDELKSFANNVRAGQPPANILFAAVHFLLLRGTQHPLRLFYPTLHRGTPPHELDGAFAAFKDFVVTHRAELAPLVRSRVTNTNEVGRSALLHAGFRALARDADEPLHLIELGPSAGFDLIWDRYGVRYIRAGESIHAGPAHAPLVLETELRGQKCRPRAQRPMWRIGSDWSAIRSILSCDDERDWLRALVWPDHIARFARLEKVLEIHASARPPIREGDALALLPDALGEIPPDQTACVYHSFVTYQFSDEERAALDDLLVGASLRRPLWRLSLEGTLSGEAPLFLHRYRDGVRDTRLLAHLPASRSMARLAGMTPARFTAVATGERIGIVPPFRPGRTAWRHRPNTALIRTMRIWPSI